MDSDGPRHSDDRPGETAVDSGDTGPADDTGYIPDTSDTSDTSHTGETGDTDCFATDWYPDLDGDEYGDEGAPEHACEPTVPNPVLTGGDCDDTNAAVNPDADEICGDGLDNNCDERGCGPFEEIEADDADARLQGPTLYSGFGTAIAVLPDEDGSGRPLVAVGAPGQGRDGLDPTDTWVFAEVVDGGAEDMGVRLSGTGYADAFGTALASAGDVDGDGLGDLWVSAPEDSTEGPGCFGLFLFTSPTTPQASTDARATVHGGIGEYGGSFLSRGDADGDGVPDLLVGNPAAGGGSRRGEVRVLPGTAAATGSLSDLAWSVTGAATNDTLDQNAAGDVDGDGVDDLLLGAIGSDTGAGRAFLVRGPLRGDRSAADADLVLIGDNAADASGRAVAILGDLDGDGLPELGVGSPDQPYGFGDGRLSVHPGLEDGSLALTDTWLVIDGTGPAGFFGRTVTSGDFDGDGRTDLAVGSPYLVDRDLDRGKVSVFRSPGGGSLTEDDADGALFGSAEGWFGASLVSGDLEGDGYDDLLVGAPEGEDRGMIFLVSGGVL